MPLLVKTHQCFIFWLIFTDWYFSNWFLPCSETINKEVCCEISRNFSFLKKLRRSIQNKHQGMLSKDVIYIHDNARTHTANVTKNSWRVLTGTASDLGWRASDFHLFLNMKAFLANETFYFKNEFLDSRNILNPEQFGLRKIRSTILMRSKYFGKYIVDWPGVDRI